MNEIAYAWGFRDQENVRPHPSEVRKPETAGSADTIFRKSCRYQGLRIGQVRSKHHFGSIRRHCTTKGHRSIRGSSQALFEQATGGEGLDRAADIVKSQS